MGRNRHKTRNDNHPKPQSQSTKSQSIYSLNSLGESFDETLWNELKNLAMNSENEQSKTTNKTNDK